MRRTVGNLDGAALDIETYGSLTEHLVDPQLRGPVAVGQDDPFGCPVAGEDLFGQGRSVVGEMQLLSHQFYGARKAFGTQCLGRPPPGQRCADHNDGGVV